MTPMLAHDERVRVLPRRGREWQKYAEQQRAIHRMDQLQAAQARKERLRLRRLDGFVHANDLMMIGIASPIDPDVSLYPSMINALGDDEDGGGVVIPSDNTYAEFDTETTATPSTTRMTVAEGKTAVIIWVDGFQSASLLANAFVWLYVTVGANTRKIKAFRWQRHYLAASPGDAVKVGCMNQANSSGVVVSYGLTDGTFPTTEGAISGSTGNANCDFSSPVLWEPTNAHVTLTSEDSEVLFNDPGSDKMIWVSESPDGSTGWTKPVQCVLIDNDTQVYTARYRYLAFMAMTDGLTVNVTCTGTISGSVNEYETDSMFGDIATGSVLTVNSSSDGFGGDQGTYSQNFEYAVNAASSGDAIVLDEAGTITLTRILGNTAGAARYSKNLTILATEAVTITGYGFQGPNMTYTWGLGGAITYDLASVSVSNAPANAMVDVNSGALRLHGVTITGPGSGTAKNLIYIGGSGTLKSWKSTAQTAGRDVISASGASCYVETHACTISTAGANASDNLYTSHSNALMVDYGSTLTKNGGAGPAIVPSSTPASTYLFGSICNIGTGSVFELGSGTNALSGVHTIRCNQVALNSNATWVVGSYLFASTGSQIFRPDAGQLFSGNRFTAGSEAGSDIQIEVRGPATIEANLFYNCRTGVQTSSSGTHSLLGDTWYLTHNTFDSFISINLQNAEHGEGSILNNVFGAGPFVATSTNGDMVSDGNIFISTIDTDYTKILASGALGSSDANNTTPGIDATTYRPNASGNCDNEGATTNFDWYGGIGPDCRALSHSLAERVRGCFGVARLATSPVYYGGKR